MLEGGGRSVRSELATPNSFPRPTCDRTDCPLAGSEDGCRERCYHEHVGYVGECTRCRVVQHGQGVAEADIVAREYDGETGRTLFTRSNQHYQGCVPEQERGALPAKISETKLPYQLGWHHSSIDWGGFVSLNYSPTEQQKQVTNKQIREGVGCYESFENLCYSYVSELI